MSYILRSKTKTLFRKNFITLEKKMETIKVEILNPKAKYFLKGLAELNLINLVKSQKESDFTQLLEKLRKQSDTAPSLNEIAEEVESERKERYEN